MGISADLSSECRFGRSTPRPNDLSYCEMCAGSLSTDDPTCLMTPYSAAQSSRGQDAYPPTFARTDAAGRCHTHSHAAAVRASHWPKGKPQSGLQGPWRPPHGFPADGERALAPTEGGPNSAPENDQIMPTTRLTRNPCAGRQDRCARRLRTRCDESVILRPRRQSSESGVSGGTALRRP